MARLSAAERARRLLALLHLLEPDIELSLADIARTLGISEEEAAEDLNLLSCCGLHPYTPDALVPLYIDDGVVRVFGVLPSLERPVRLTAGEARALASALELAGLAADTPLTTKLLENAAASEVSPDDVVRLLGSPLLPETGAALETLAAGLSERRCVRLTYRSAENRVTDRVVEPLGLVNEGAVWYLEAFCRMSGGLRTFRMDRVASAELLTEVFGERDLSPSGKAFSTEGLPLARIHATGGAVQTVGEWPGARVVEQSQASVVFEVPYAGTTWLSRQVVAAFGEAVVLGPAELREAVASLARAEIAAAKPPANGA